MARRLGLGQYCGKSVRRRQIHGFVITENWFAPGLQIDRHVHDHPHFTYIIEGTFTESYDRMVLECVRGSTLFVPAEAPHTDRIGPQGAHTIGVEISPAVAERVLKQTGLLADSRVLLEPRLDLNGRKLYREFRSSDPAAALSMESLAIEMMVITSRTKAGSEQSEPSWMGSIRDVLHEKFADPITLGDLAAQIGIHETHLARSFRRRHGCSVGEYIRRLRVDAAAMQLKRTMKSIAEIAAENGFYDQAHFCRTFKKVYGLSPSEYRSK